MEDVNPSGLLRGSSKRRFYFFGFRSRITSGKDKLALSTVSSRFINFPSLRYIRWIGVEMIKKRISSSIPKRGKKRIRERNGRRPAFRK